MAHIDIERIPALVAEGKMSKKEGAYRIWEDIYCNPHKYGLALLDEDEKSDFLLSLLEKFEHAISDFVPQKAKFSTYLHGRLKIAYIGWHRKRLTDAVGETITRTALKAQYDEEVHKYETADNAAAGEKPAILTRASMTPKQRSLAKITALILTLKHCHDVDGTIIKNVSRFVDTDVAALESLVRSLRKQSDHKVALRARVIRRRDNAFYYHRKYLNELSQLQKGTARFEKVQQKYQKQTENWIRQNKLLAHRFVLSPTNESIAKEIGIKPRRVSFYIRRAVRNNHPFLSDKRDEPKKEPGDEEI
ncbi:MAG: hypothetical protein K2N31_02375 [Treponemataceae bacterium]|nr:hypothetical protein [Treponemataceae bacterium]